MSMIYGNISFFTQIRKQLLAVQDCIQLYQLRYVVHEQSGKVEYEREKLLGIPKKLTNFHSDSQQPFALVFDFSALLGDNLN